MNTEKELRKWLNRPEQDFLANLSFGTKAWHSLELSLLTKYEVVIEEFCQNLPKFRKELSKRDAEYVKEAWGKVHDLLSLTYSTGAVNVHVKAKLVEALSEEARYSLKKASPSLDVLNALLITLHNTSMLNYYKSSGKDFAKFIATNLRYLNAVVVHENGKLVDQNALKEMVEGVVKSLRTYIRQTPYLDTFKEFFSTEVFAPLSELVILLRSTLSLDYASEQIAILQELLFDGSQTDSLKKFLRQPNGESDKLKDFQRVFQVPAHVFLLTVETVLISFKNDADLLVDFFKYLFAEESTVWTSVTQGNQDKLNCVTYFFLLLKKHDVSLSFEINNVKAHSFLGARIESLVAECHEQHQFEVMNLVCAALRLNALILEHSAVQIAVKFMLAAKTEEKEWKKYEELMFLLIEMFRKLCRAEKLVSQLIKNLWEALATVKLSKKTKRSLNGSFVEGATPKKRGRKEGTDAGIEKTSTGETNYFQLLLNGVLSGNEKSSAVAHPVKNTPSTQTWSEIAFAFPPSVAADYTKLISGLVSKPSLVVWKTLIFTLKDFVMGLADDTKSTENSAFMIEFTCALLSQYFIGCRLAEQADKSWDAIEANRKQTYGILADFGHAILNQEHNYRTMNAFLKLCYHVSNFDLVCWYYCPDSMHADNAMDVDDEDSTVHTIDGLKNAQNIHSYLTPKEWTIIEQRITNFGKRECKANINQIYLQRVKATFLFRDGADASSSPDITKTLLSMSTTFSDVDQIVGILEDQTVGAWFVNNLDAQQKQLICELLLEAEEQDLTVLLSDKIQDKEYVTIVILAAFKFIVKELCSGKKASLLKSVDLEQIFGEAGRENVTRDLANVLAKYASGEEVSVKKIKQESHESIARCLTLLNESPIGFASEELKNVLALFNLAFYFNFKSAEDDVLVRGSLDLFKKILHFDHFPALFRFTSIDTLITIFNNDPEAAAIFDMIFDRVSKQLNEENCKMLDGLIDLLNKYKTADKTRKDTLLDIAVIAFVQLSKNKKAKEYFEKLRDSLLTIIKGYFVDKDDKKGDSKALVLKTLPAFVTVVKSVVGKGEVDEELGQVTKVFLKESINCNDQFAVKLLNVVLNNRASLTFTDDELKEIIDQYWDNFKICCLAENSESKDGSVPNLETVLKIIFDFKSTEDWIRLLDELEESIKKNVFTSEAKQNSRILACMSKCQFNKAKGQIYSEFFKQVTFWTTLSLRSKEDVLKLNLDAVLDLIKNQIVIVNNVQIPVAIELIDDILSFMSELNIKKFDFMAINIAQSAEIFHLMADLCQALINQRHFFIMDRIAQFVHVFKDLLQAVCWYKSKRNKTDNLEAAEVTMLAEIAHKLEKISKSLVSHAKEVKRVAPYVLVYIINLMISSDRPTTLYPKIKTPFEYICYDLIAICDHRVDGFILRCCNEASKPVYETLVKEYQKYHKFKGKV